MGTKNNPAPNDCYAKAEADEPLFILLARDPTAAHLVSIWSKLRVGDFEAAAGVYKNLVMKMLRREEMGETEDYSEKDVEKSEEAMKCSLAMFEWIKANRPERAL